jgi:hypothetical protein
VGILGGEKRENLLVRRHVKDTVPKCAKRYGRKTGFGEVGQRHLQNAHGGNDWRSDGRDEEENAGDEEKKSADMVEEACLHVHGDAIEIMCATEESISRCGRAK